jgi:hypothetical protein
MQTQMMMQLYVQICIKMNSDKCDKYTVCNWAWKAAYVRQDLEKSAILNLNALAALL